MNIIKDLRDAVKYDWCQDALHRTCTQAADHIDEARKLLKDLEWKGSIAVPLCPSCGRRKDLGHRDDCRLKLFLEAHQNSADRVKEKMGDK